MVGNHYKKVRNFGKARDYYQRALKLDPENSFALYGLGDCWRGEQNYAKAEAVWNKLVTKEPRNNNVLTRLGDIYLRLGEDDKARQCYHRVLSRSNNKYARMGLSRLYRKAGDYEKAIQNYEKILEYEERKDERVLGEIEATRAEIAARGVRSDDRPARGEGLVTGE
jgi:tetratricopeptide (TPR) repeat protein